MKKFLYSIILNSKFRALILLSLGIFHLVSLISYSPYDKSFNTVSYHKVSNYLGFLGAYSADFFISYFGLSSLLITYLLFSWSRFIYQRREISFLYFRLLSFLISIISISLILDYDVKFEGVNTNLGGLFPYFFKLTNIYINSFYLNVIFLLISIICFVLSLGYSNAELIEFIKNNKLRISLRNISHRNNFKSNSKNLKSRVTKTYNNNSSQKIEEVASLSAFNLPPVNLFEDHHGKRVKSYSKEELEENANELIKVLNDFGIKGKVIDYHQGPVVTLYEFEPSAGIKSSRVIGLADDIARSLSASSARIAVIRGRNALGIELPNETREFFGIKQLIESDSYQNNAISLPIILGKNLSGQPKTVDLAKMPHLLIAGTTGSGKSVALNTMILSLLYKHSPESCKFIMIDPKMLELSVYSDIPHLLTPVVTEPEKAVIALKWAVKEMEQRYRNMSNLGVRNIAGFNSKIDEAIRHGKTLEKNVQVGFDEETGHPKYELVKLGMEKMPYIVVIVDEMADLMLVAGKDIESLVQRLAQMARAAGIHLIMATQRPSVDVITGVIKANFPSRVSFKVTSKIDSRTILGEQGAEQLLGMGDMLYMGSHTGVERIHGPFVKDEEVEEVTNFLKSQGSPEYVTGVTEEDDEEPYFEADFSGNEEEMLYRKALMIVKKERKSSTSYIQRSLRIGYNRAAIIVERMEKEGILSEPNHSGKREILID